MDDVDWARPILGAGSGRPTFPQLAYDSSWYWSRRGVHARRNVVGELPAATPREGIGTERNVGTNRECAHDSGCDFADAGTVAEERSAVERDTKGVDVPILPGASERSWSHSADEAQMRRR
jgi:hypothetical protein